MTGLLRPFIVTGASFLLAVAPSRAADHDHVGAGSNDFFVSVSHHQQGSWAQGSTDNPQEVVTVNEDVQCAPGGAQTCGEPALCDDGTIMTISTFIVNGEVVDQGSSCPVDVGPVQPPAVTPGIVSAAFRRLSLPASKLQVQPPNGRTLVNFDTNFYTHNGEFTRTVTLLGRRVELRIWPARYGWRFGDGQQRWTTTPGDRYPHLEVTHRYLREGRVSPSVDTTYAARFRVGGGPWRDVNGTVTIPGSPQALRVVTARPVLVGG